MLFREKLSHRKQIYKKTIPKQENVTIYFLYSSTNS